MKRLLAIFAAAALTTFAVNAQVIFFPGWYLEVQGGAMYSSSNEWGYAGWDKVKHLNLPNASLNLGYEFTPVFALRGALSGPFGNFPGPDHMSIHRFGYAQATVDAKFDILNMFRFVDTRIVSPYIFAGAGLNYRFPVESKEAFLGPAVRLGGGLEFRLSNLVDLTLELQDNALHNKFNTLTAADTGTDRANEYHGDDGLYYGGEVLLIKKPFRWDDNIAALVGLKFNIGANKKRIAAAAAALAAAEAEAARLAAEAEAARLAAEAEAARLEAERLAAEKAEADRLAAEAAEKAAAEAARFVTEHVFFELDKADLRDSEMPKVQHLIDVLNKYPDATIDLSAYADKETGNHKRNMDLSKRRVEVVAKALKDAGIAADRINTDYYGDTVRVAPEAEENRVTICVTK